LQAFDRGDDSNPIDGAEREQIAITRDDEISRGGAGTIDNNGIVHVPKFGRDSAGNGLNQRDDFSIPVRRIARGQEFGEKAPLQSRPLKDTDELLQKRLGRYASCLALPK